MKKAFKIVSAFLVIFMLGSLLLSGCGQSGTENGQNAATEGTQAGAGTTAAVSSPETKNLEPGWHLPQKSSRLYPKAEDG